ncbi:MAG: MaoC family dehydratase [Bacteroidota bacterium]|nr:MaoC family dehydratase [Bacteroidota bacterium]|tara:strand:- start:36 stop:440 length:405 start_codon:yes stop_codon:yes gene_type:complete
MKLKIGDNHKEEFIITQEMVNRFAELSGDKNPLHIDKKFAAKTRFKKPIVHGLFSVTSFGKVMGTKFPGSGSIHVAQNLSFKRPLYPDTKYYVYIELIRIVKEKHFGVFKTQIFDTNDNLVVDGTGTALHEEKL